MRDGEPSLTAQRVAAHRLGFPRAQVPYGDPSGDVRLMTAVARGVTVNTASPMARHLAARTAFFDDVVVRSLASGTTQVVVAGAGYDGRSLRFAKPGVRWFELDHPDTQRDKLRVLAAEEIDTTSVTFVGADFRDGSLVSLLEDAGLERGTRTLIVCEGVAVYLDDDVLERLVGDLRRACDPPSRLALSLSAVLDTPEKIARRARFEARVSGIGESIRSSLIVEAAAPLFERTAWRLSERTNDDELTVRERRAGFALLDAV